MDKVQYCEIFEDGVQESFEKLETVDGERYFQQDNDPKHMSGLATKWFEDNNIQVLGWLSETGIFTFYYYYFRSQLWTYLMPTCDASTEANIGF